MILAADRRQEWNALVAACPHGDVLQCWEWGELKSRTGWLPIRLGIERAGRLAAGCALLKRPLPAGRSLLYAPRGPIVDFGDAALWPELAEEMRQTARIERALAVKLDPAIPAENRWVAQALAAEGFRPATSAEAVGGTQPRQVMKVDLTPSEEDLLAGFEPKWRYNIRLAERKGVTVSHECSREDLEVFYELLLVTGRRDGFTVRARSYFHDLWDLLVVPGLARLFLARVGEEVIAGTLLFSLPPQAWYVYGASANEHRNLMPNHALQWAMMRWSRAQSCRVYDMRGVAPERDGEAVGPLAGLNRFKRGFGAEYVEYLGDWDLVCDRLGYWAFQKALPWVRNRGRRIRAQEEA